MILSATTFDEAAPLCKPWEPRARSREFFSREGWAGDRCWEMEGWRDEVRAGRLLLLSEDLEPLLRGFDERVAAEGGRVYFAKDSRLDARMVPRMYPRLDEWRAVRDRLDPHGALTSDLDRRLDLTGHRR